MPSGPRRLPRELVVPDTSLWFNLEVAAQRFPNKAAYLFFGQPLTYRELQAQAEALAGWLQRARRGARRPRGRSFMQNCPQLVIAHFAILRANAVVVPVNPMNRAEELKHYITDPDAKVVISHRRPGRRSSRRPTRALPPERAAARTCSSRSSPTRCPSRRARPRRGAAAGVARLAARRPAAAALAAATSLDRRARPPATRRPAARASAPTTWRCCPTPRAPPACPRAACTRHRTLMHNAVGGQLWGHAAPETVALGGGADVPHHRHGVRVLGTVFVGAHAGDHAALGPRARRPADLAPQGHALDQHPDHGHRPVRRARTSRASTCRSLRYIGGGGAAMPQAVAQRLLERVRPDVRRRLRPHRNRRADARQPARARQAAVPGHPDLRASTRAWSTRDTLEELPIGEVGRDHHPRARGLPGLLEATRTPPPRPSSSSRASASSAPATWAAWTRTATSSSPTASSA